MPGNRADQRESVFTGGLLLGAAAYALGSGDGYFGLKLAVAALVTVPCLYPNITTPAKIAKLSTGIAVGFYSVTAVVAAASQVLDATSAAENTGP